MLKKYKFILGIFEKNLKLFKFICNYSFNKVKLLIQATAVEQAIVAVSAAPKENPL